MCSRGILRRLSILAWWRKDFRGFASCRRSLCRWISGQRCPPNRMKSQSLESYFGRTGVFAGGAACPHQWNSRWWILLPQAVRSCLLCHRCQQWFPQYLEVDFPLRSSDRASFRFHAELPTIRGTDWFGIGRILQGGGRESAHRTLIWAFSWDHSLYAQKDELIVSKEEIEFAYFLFSEYDSKSKKSI